MKKLLVTIGKVFGFFITWAILISIFTMDYFDKPPLIPVNPATNRLWWEITPFIAIIIVTLIFEKGIEKMKVHTKLTEKPLKEFILGLFLGVIWIGLSVLVMKFLGIINFASKNDVKYMWIWVIAALINVIMQEYLVRGYIFNVIKSNYNNIIATVVSTLIFTSLHGGAFKVGIVAVLNVLTMSIFVSLLLIYTKALLAPIIVHFIWNAVGCLYLGGVSLADDYPNLWNLIFTGSKLLTGGASKMEGSIVVLFMNTIMIIIVGIMMYKNKNFNKNEKYSLES